MRLKKFNAVLSLITVIVMLVHVGMSYRVLSGWSNPISIVIAALTFGLVILHAIISICIFIFVSDGKKITYPKSNVSTILQRLSGILMLLLLFLFHVRPINPNSSFALIQGIGMILFFASVTTHIAVSVPKAIITLGLVKNERTLKIISIVLAVICAGLMVDFGALAVRTFFI